ncbi:MAG: valine--tRNA ligase [Terriglobales bacterium]
MFLPLEKIYDPSRIEPRWAQRWAESDWFHARTDSERPSWSLVIPPPNVTGSLHLGHMLEHAQIDAVVRWRRMSGDNTLWLPGTDHAGIATQLVVERELAKQGLDRRQLGREAFVAKVWEWKERSGGAIRRAMVRLGDSCDWSRERFTLDAGLSRAVREVFVSLYEEGLIYRGRYLVNWCPRCRTALSDLEVVHEETVGQLYRIRYPFADDPSYGLDVDTTRPETMLGDVAVAVNPGDERYRGAIGRQVRLPLAGRMIPVIADELARPEFGTGAVKVTPAHDANDFAAGERHGLPQIEVIDEGGAMTAAAGAYAGLDRFAARERILADLEAAGLSRGAAEHPMALGRCQRCRTVVEPHLSAQWFVKIAPLADEAVRAVAEGHITFNPDSYRRIYLDWMANIHDWCISRQLWWGHRIPAWYCRGRDAGRGCGRVLVGRDDPTACPDCGGALERDPDVLDTWFSSALWPFSTLGWPEATADLATFYPTSLLITGFDILFFWVARMIMMGVHFRRRDGLSLAASVPFRQVHIHGLVRDAERQKMSKTKGNVVDPLEIIARYGTDAVRFTLIAMAVPGGDIALAEGRLEGYQAFANKIWNAARFIFMSLERAAAQASWEPRPPAAEAAMRPQGGEVMDRWLFSRLNAVARRIEESLADFRFHEAADALYHFLWHEFCDWYLELLKPRLNASDRAMAALAAANLVAAFDAVLRLLHPFMPFLSEELWQTLAGERPPAPTLGLATWPRAEFSDEAAERQIALVQEAVTEVRARRAASQVPANARLSLRLAPRTSQDGEDLASHLALVNHLARVEASLGPLAEAGGARITTAHFDLQLDLRQSIDPAAERARLAKQRDETQARLAATIARLADPRFAERAPPHIREEQARKRDDYAAQLEKLDQALAALAAETA